MTINKVTGNMNRVFSVTLPIRANSTKRKKEALNLNVYRNMNHYLLAAQKKTFFNEVSNLIKHIPKMNKIKIHYTIYIKTRRRIDLMNIGCIVDKYFSDTLVECGIIPDDDYIHLPYVSFSFGGILATEFVEATITEITINKKKQHMKIILNKNDIREAIDLFIEEKGLPETTEVSLAMESDGEIYAHVEFINDNSDDDDDTGSEEEPKVKTKGAKRGRKPKSKNAKQPDESSVFGNVAGDSTSTEGSTEDTSKTEPEAKTSSKNLFSDIDEGDKPSEKKVTAKKSIFDV